MGEQGIHAAELYGLDKPTEGSFPVHYHHVLCRSCDVLRLALAECPFAAHQTSLTIVSIDLPPHHQEGSHSGLQNGNSGINGTEI